MEFDKLLETRRSVRAFDETKKVSEGQIRQLVEAGIQAPSWKNSQTARYYCVLSDEMKNRSGFDRDGNPDNECGNGWGYYDLGLHNENFILKAKELGLDTLIMGIRDSEKIRKELNIPETETVVSVIAVGYGTVAPAKPKRKAVDDILKFY